MKKKQQLLSPIWLGCRGDESPVFKINLKYLKKKKKYQKFRPFLTTILDKQTWPERGRETAASFTHVYLYWVYICLEIRNLARS